MNRAMRVAVPLLLLIGSRFASADYVAVETINANGGNYSATCVGLSAIDSAACSATYTAPAGFPAYRLSASVSSSGDSAGLHASAASSIYAEGGGAIVAIASESLADTLTFSSAVSLGEVWMTFTAIGTEFNGEGDSSLELNNLEANSCSFVDAGSCTVSVAVDFSQLLIVDASLSAQASNTVEPGHGTSGFANFGDTAYVSALKFTDASGAPLAVSYTSSSGLSYPMPQVSGVPEPGSGMLLFAGLVGIALSAQRPQSR